MNNHKDWVTALEMLKGAYAQSTIDAYYRDFCVFVQWCHVRGIEPLPCGARDVAAFLDEQSKARATATVRRYAVSVGKIHRLMHFDDPTKVEVVRLALRRSQRSAIAPQRQSVGLTREDVNAIVEMRHQSLRHLRDAAMISVGFDGLMRRSEIVSLRTTDVKFLADRTAQLLVRRSKNDQCARGRVVRITEKSSIVLENWISARGSGVFLFVPVCGDVVIDRGMNSIAVQRAIVSALSQLGYRDIRRYTGHALRVGAAQELLKIGCDTAGIMKAGGWKSVSSLARYLEHADHSVWSS